MTHGKFKSALAFVCAFFFISDAGAQIVLEITKGQERPVPIAVVPFGWARPDKQDIDIAEIVAADLQRSGKFAPVDRRDMRQDMYGSPTPGTPIDFALWKTRLAVDYIVIGKVSPGGDVQNKVQFQLFNAGKGGSPLADLTFPSTNAQMRRVGHQIADAIYKELTGTSGAFATRIAFVRVTGTPPTQRYELVVADSDSQNQISVFRSTWPIMSPAWSPDGKSVAFVSFESKSAEIIVQDVATGEQRHVSQRAGINGAPAWAPDGRTMALTLSRKDGDVDVYTLSLDSQVLTRMTFDPGIDTEPAWSIDGKKLYFMSDRAGNPQIYEIDVSDPRSPRRLTFDGSYNARPRVSPDGKKLALMHRENGNDRIAILDLTSKSLLVVSDGHDDESPSFAPNGAMIMYATRIRGRSVLKVASSNGNLSGDFQIEGEVREPSWGPLQTK
jgi:TolB protein